jgi:Carboxypeptidase regulatory-like domain/Beta propeller domain
MWTRPALLLLGALFLAPPFVLAQHDARPRRTMQPFGSDVELVQYLAALDRARPSRQHLADYACADTARLAPGGKRVDITGRVRDPAGTPIANARIWALGRCTTAGADGRYRLELPAAALATGSRIQVTAGFLGYRRATRTIAVRRRIASADFTLRASPVHLEEASVDASPLAAVSMRDESITNTQHSGVDEGGIVKLHGDYLVVLRRGRLFTVSVRAGELRPIATVDAYPPGAEPAEWYDEMLVAGDRVIVIGYSYRRGGTEVSLFAIDGRGELRHLSTSHLRSNDYYSSRNYAARLVGEKLVFYTPLLLGFADPLASLPAMREWRPGAEGGFERIATPRRIYRPALVRQRPAALPAGAHPRAAGVRAGGGAGIGWDAAGSTADELRSPGTGNHAARLSIRKPS